MTPTEDSLQQLAQRAEMAVAEAKAQATALEAEGSRRTEKLKRAGLVVLIVICAASLATQWRAIREPFRAVLPGENAAAVQSDLHAIAMYVEAFRLSQGRLPDNLVEVNLPGTLAALVSDQGVRYERSAATYTLRWTSAPLQATYDGASGQVTAVSAGKP